MVLLPSAALQKGAGSRLLIDKSPTYGASPHILARGERLFRGARYIHLVRHPYAVIESFVRLRMDKLLGANSENPHTIAERIWTETNKNILETVAPTAPERYHRILYEDLVRDPRTVLASCCEFLGVPFDEALLKPYAGSRMTEGIHTVSISVGDPDFLKHDDIDARLGERWREIDLSHQLKPASRVLAAEFGYELAHEEVMAAPRESFLETVRGLRLCLCEWGAKEGPLILLLHGILEQGASWMGVAPMLAAQGFHVIAPDLRGHGLSDHVGRGGSYQLMDFVADIDSIAAHTAGGEPFTLVGHSFGSVIAALFASARPAAVRSLVLVETPVTSGRQASDSDESGRLKAMLDYLAAPPRHVILPSLEAAGQRMMRALPGLSQPLALKLAQRNTVASGNGLEWRWDPLLGTRAGLSFGDESGRYVELLRNLRPPVTLVFGSDSTLKTSVSATKEVVVPGGHNLHLEQPARLADVIAEAAERETIL